MKFRRNLYRVIGVFLILVNVWVDIVDMPNIMAQISPASGFSFGYLIGSQFLLIIGIVFLTFSHHIKKKLLNKDLEKAVNEIGRPS